MTRTSLATPRETVSPDEARGLLFEERPAMLVGLGGTIQAANLLAEMLFNRRLRGDLLGVHVCEHFAQLILDGHAPIERSLRLALRKLAYWRTLGEKRKSPLYRQLWDLVKQEAVRQGITPLPADEPRKQSRRYALAIRPPDSWSSPELVDFEGFDSAIVVSDTDDDAIDGEQLFVAVFEPTNGQARSTVKAMYDEVIDRFGEDDYVRPRDVNRIVYRQALGSLVRMLRARHEMSAQDLAVRLGVTRPAVTHWEYGRRSLDDANLSQLIDVLEPSVDERARLLALSGRPAGPREGFSRPDTAFNWTLKQLNRITDLQTEITGLQTELASQVAELHSVILANGQLLKQLDPPRRRGVGKAD